MTPVGIEVERLALVSDGRSSTTPAVTEVANSGDNAVDSVVGVAGVMLVTGVSSSVGIGVGE